MHQRLDWKGRLVERLFAEFNGRPASVLDLGCGTGHVFVHALRRYPNVSYTGVEQDKVALQRAQETIGRYGNVTLRHGFAESFATEGYDLVLSLSVLEHVKRLEQFLATSVRAAKPGGRVVHRYDLGHALTPSTWGERLRVTVCRWTPALAPASGFATYPDLRMIVEELRRLGLDEIGVSQAQLWSLKKAANLIDTSTATGRALMSDLVDLDERLWRHLGASLHGKERDRLFPTVTVSGIRVRPQP